MRFPTLLAALSLAGCGILTPVIPGQSREADVLAHFGQPASTRTVGDARVLEFPREPIGFENWRVTLGPDGIVRSVEQLVDEPTFAKILPGITRDEVLQLLGRPSETSAYPNLAEEVVSWRYLELGNRLMFFNAHFDPSGRLKYASRTVDPAMWSVDDN